MRLLHAYLLGFLLLATLSSCSPINVGSEGRWDFQTGEFSWRSGTVRLPPGWTYAQRGSADSFAGAFVSPDGKRWIGFDIGGSAGLWATEEDCLFDESVVDNTRIWTAQLCRDKDTQTPNRYAVTFPDSGPANFYMRADNAVDAEPIWFIAQSFRPN